MFTALKLWNFKQNYSKSSLFVNKFKLILGGGGSKVGQNSG